jgi:hypothetical protein
VSLVLQSVTFSIQEVPLVRRIITLALSLSMVLGLSTAGRLFAQDEKKDQAKTEEVKKADAPAPAPADTKKAEAKPAEPAKAAEAPLPTIPPEVEAKLEAARRAVAEAIVAAQDAGLVETSIEPPPILDILLTGRALDARALKAITKDAPEAGVSPEVFGAWFTGFGKPTEGITADKNVRIIQPSKGLSEWYRTRAEVLNRHIDEVRKAKAAAPKAEEKKEEPKPEAKPEEKKEEPKPEAKPEEKKEEPKPEAKPEEKKEEPKADAPKN